MFHYNVSRYANLIQHCMDSMDRHELVIVETDGMTIVETRCWFSVPFHTTPWSCDTNVSHRSQVSEWKVQRWASIRHRDHRLMACSSWTSLDMVKCTSLISAFTTTLVRGLTLFIQNALQPCSRHSVCLQMNKAV